MAEDRNMEVTCLWRPIDGETPNDVLLWNGVKVDYGWRDGDDDNPEAIGLWQTNDQAEYTDYKMDPQPTHWMPFPDGPKI